MVRHFLDVSALWKRLRLFWGPFLTSPLGANFNPQGWICPLGVKLPPGGDILCSPLHSSKQ
jgi:hypothetical protein